MLRVQPLFIVLVLYGISIILNLLANMFKSQPVIFILFYQILLIIIVGTFLPLWYTKVKSNQPLSDIGLSLKKWLQALLIGMGLDILSLPWRFLVKDLVLPRGDIFLYTSISLLMTSIFEEVFFRGFLQKNIEKSFGMIPAIICSGIAFSIYHIGYSDFRTLSQLIGLFFVGIFFAISFRITNNVITSIMVNWPHAVMTFFEKKIYFDQKTAGISLFTTIIILTLITVFLKKEP